MGLPFSWLPLDEITSESRHAIDRRCFYWLVGVRLDLSVGIHFPCTGRAGSSNDREGLPLPRSDVAEATELPEPFVPKLSRTEADADRLEALQLYAAGRLKEQQQQLPAALQFYQRAYRRDPAAVTVLKQIIPLAFNLGRSEEAFRYALKLGQAEPNDPVLLRQLGVHLAGEGKLPEAVSFYEQAWKLERERGKRAPSTVLLLAQLGKMYLIDERPAQAADTYAEVISALDKPDEYKLDKRSRQLVLEDAAKTLELLGIDTGERGEEASAFELFGRAFLEAGRLDQAQTAFERAKQVKPDEGLNGWYRAQLAAARGEHEAAIAALDAYFKAHRTSHGLAPYQLLERELGKLDKTRSIDRATRCPGSCGSDQRFAPLFPGRALSRRRAIRQGRTALRATRER